MPSVQLFDVNGARLFEGNNAVFVSVEEISETPKENPLLLLKGEVSDFSCCRAANCPQLKRKMHIECDCNNKDAALCAVPVNGIVSFYNLTVNKAGSHRLKYIHTEIMPRLTVSDTIEERVSSFQDTSGFTIVSGPTDQMSFVHQTKAIAIGNSTGDEAAMLNPQPSCG